ncbi:MAG: hypothetical protein ABI670_18410 [Chloroflexota bacterium]
MADSNTKRDMYSQEAGSYTGGLACASATQGNEYGFSYYWWYYYVPTTNCHALETKS